ncbi:hypothetical protein SADUNF_Sadunf07G0064400 [Salix dunnii]|uniref:Uncharacterized protein n=1 Tax=Salix dunnii TaxID=1413687 RepID=A0A835K1K2_9ROSI|nr:hypothetical protein SADUNF_Sadunf07G0064400 [Salix dunnii]
MDATPRRDAAPGTGAPTVVKRSSITATRPSTPSNFARVPGTVAGDGSHAGRKSGPTPAGNRVINNGNTSGHVPRHAGRLCRRPGGGGRRRVFAGRKSGLRYRAWSGLQLGQLASLLTLGVSLALIWLLLFLRLGMKFGSLLQT